MWRWGGEAHRQALTPWTLHERERENHFDGTPVLQYTLGSICVPLSPPVAAGADAVDEDVRVSVEALHPRAKHLTC